jgi:hypothetical protein
MTSDRLLQVFEYKRVSSAEFREVQRKHGLLLTPENLFADWATREGAIELHKGIHWFNLELQEFLGASREERPEELADVLHFLVELAILAGFDYTLVPDHPVPGNDRLDTMLEASTDDVFVLPDPEANARFAIISGLHLAELIKNKPWKQTLKTEIDVAEFKRRICGMFYWYGAVVRTAGLSSADLFSQFTRKDEINHTRVTTGV